MQEYWELYMKQIDGKPASVQCHVGLSMELEELEQNYPTVAFVKVTLKGPNEKGLLSQNEEAEILYLEDKLEEGIIKFRLGKYVGRIVSDGFVTFLYYVPYTYNWQDFLEYTLKEHTSYEMVQGHEEDATWNYYKHLLYPNAKEWQILQNHKVCDTLQEAGDTLTVSRAIEHTLYFQDETNKEKLLTALEQQNFHIKEELTNEEGYQGVKFFRKDKPFYSDVDEITLALIELLEQHGATYDGWETSIVK
jgi:hypothetical protein